MSVFWKILWIVSISMSFVEFCGCFQEKCEVLDHRLNPFDGELIFAHTICRHGARNIYMPYKTDPWKSLDHWEGGFGELTNVGKMQQYKLGQYLRNRYADLLIDGSYSPRKIYVQSTVIKKR